MNQANDNKADTEIVTQLCRAAKLGDAEALYQLGFRYFNGKGIPLNPDMAKECWQKAAELGHVEAQQSLDECCGDDVCPKVKQITKLIDEAAKKIQESLESIAPKAAEGDAVAMYLMGVVCLKNMPLMFKLLERLGDDSEEVRKAQAEFQVMGERFYRLAVKQWRKAATQEDVHAQRWLGYCYASGEGVRQDYVKSTKWYRKAAEQGDVHAQCSLGCHYYEGKGVVQNYTKAVKWFRKAAEQGLAIAQYNIGLFYANGKGVAEDKVEAATWYRKAAEQGDEDAIDALKEIELAVNK